MKVRLSARRSKDERCAFCHDALEGAIATCPRCATPFHKDCRAHLGQCPTLGCGTVFTASPDVEFEKETPASLPSELARERAGALLLGPALAIALALLVASNPAGPAVLGVAALIAAGLAWSAWFLVSELGFFRALSRLLAQPPVMMSLEIHAERREEDRVFVAHLVDPKGGRIVLDLESDRLLGGGPGWLLMMPPGTTVSVFTFGDRGPVAIRTPDGHVYAVPEGRVKRSGSAGAAESAGA